MYACKFMCLYAQAYVLLKPSLAYLQAGNRQGLCIDQQPANTRAVWYRNGRQALAVGRGKMASSCQGWGGAAAPTSRKANRKPRSRPFYLWQYFAVWKYWLAVVQFLLPSDKFLAMRPGIRAYRLTTFLQRLALFSGNPRNMLRYAIYVL